MFNVFLASCSDDTTVSRKMCLNYKRTNCHGETLVKNDRFSLRKNWAFDRQSSNNFSPEKQDVDCRKNRMSIVGKTGCQMSEKQDVNGLKNMKLGFPT